MTEVAFRVQAKVQKIDDELGIVFGWGMITHVDGVPYIDVQNDSITQKALLESTVEFMEDCNVLKEMHTGGQRGEVIFGWPLTDEIAAAFEITCKFRGFMLGVRPDAEMLARFKSGELTGFSLGGYVTDYLDVEYDHAASA